MQCKQQHQGFTLVEMSVVLVILGFLLVAALLPLQAQRDIAAQLKTEQILEEAKTALIGYAQTHGRLPCPATQNGTAVFPDDTGAANPNASGACVVPSGFLPAKTLGLQSVDMQGYGVDAWQNRIHYAVTQANNHAFTTSSGMNDIGAAALSPDLRVCVSSSAASCTNRINLIDNAVAVIFSTGQTGNQVIGGLDERQNLMIPTNATFVSHTITTSSATNGEFDHVVIWLSPYTLYNAMMVAGQLH